MSSVWASNAMRVFLLILSMASFLPQAYRLSHHGSWTGISLTYLLFNLIVATEQLTLGLHLIAIDYIGAIPGIVHNPRTFGDWLNLSQLAVVWLGHVLLFVYCLQLPPSAPAPKRSMATTYFAFFLISLALIAFEATLPNESEDSSPEIDGRWFFASFAGIHSMFINPVATAIGLAAVYVQAREIRSQPSLGALSISGLFVQALVFALVGVSWLFRFTIPSEYWRMDLMRAVNTWFQLAGWAAVDNLVFAFVQAVLFFVARTKGTETPNGAETQSLLP